MVHRYFGKRIEKFSDGNKITYLDRSFSPSPITGNRTYSLDVLPLEYSSNGLGDFRTSALDIRNEFGSTLDLKFKEYRTYKGKKELKGLPASFGNPEEVESLEIDLYDQLNDVTVTLIALRKEYPCMSEGNYEVIETGNPLVMAYHKYDEQDDFIILVNFTSDEQAFDVSSEGYSLFMHNYESDGLFDRHLLRPYEAIVFKK